jgi:hypothetical protein
MHTVPTVTSRAIASEIFVHNFLSLVFEGYFAAIIAGVP